MKVNEILGSKKFLKLFLRRTLSGCEFVFCLTIDIKSNDPAFEENNPYCTIDKDPLLVFTIFVRSMFPFMAMILISLLIYLGILAKKIFQWFVFPSNSGIVLKKAVSVIANAFTSTISNAIYEKLINYLDNVLNENIKKLKINDKGNAKIIKKLKKLFESPIGDKLSNIALSISDKIKDHLGKLFTVKTNFLKLADNIINPLQMFRISAYLLLIIASFIMSFRYTKTSIKDYRTEDLLKQSDSYQYKMELCNCMDHLIKISDIKIDPKDILNKGISMIAKCFLVSSSIYRD